LSHEDGTVPAVGIQFPIASDLLILLKETLWSMNLAWLNPLPPALVGDGSGLTGVGGDSFPYTGSAIISGSLTVEGTATVTELVETSTGILKTNIQPLSSQMDNIMKLNPVSFDWKEDNKHSVGFIAEEVQKVYPEFVSKQNGQVTGINYSKLTSVLTQALQEQQKQIDELKSLLNNK